MTDTTTLNVDFLRTGSEFAPSKGAREAAVDLKEFSFLDQHQRLESFHEKSLRAGNHVPLKLVLFVR